MQHQLFCFHEPEIYGFRHKMVILSSSPDVHVGGTKGTVLDLFAFWWSFQPRNIPDDIFLTTLHRCWMLLRSEIGTWMTTKNVSSTPSRPRFHQIIQHRQKECWRVETDTNVMTLAGRGKVDGVAKWDIFSPTRWRSWYICMQVSTNRSSRGASWKPRFVCS